MPNIHAVHAFACLCAAALVSASCDDAVLLPSEAVKVSVSPASVFMRVGQSMEVKATVTPSTVSTTVLFVSFDSSVARVTQQGMVTCVAEGFAQIVVTPIADASVSTSVPVDCMTDAGPPPPQLIEASTTRYSFEHRVGTSPCPQRVGTFRLTNTSDAPAQVEVVSNHVNLTLSVSTVTLAPGQFTDVVIDFNCTSAASFNSYITLTATGAGGAIDVEIVTVEGVIG